MRLGVVAHAITPGRWKSRQKDQVKVILGHTASLRPAWALSLNKQNLFMPGLNAGLSNI